MPTGMLLAPIGNPEPKGLCPSGRPACPCSGDPSCSHTIDTLLPEQVKQAQRFARIAGKSLCLFWSALSIYGSEDRVLNKEKYEQNKSNLPDDYSETVIDGGCHAFFGVYGNQDGDGTPTITNEEQIQLTAEKIAAFAENKD